MKGGHEKPRERGGETAPIFSGKVRRRKGRSTNPSIAIILPGSQLELP
jgi:hypothetical protein